MLIASRCNNRIPLDEVYLMRACYLSEPSDFSMLLDLDFIRVINDEGEAVEDPAVQLKLKPPKTPPKKRTAKKKHDERFPEFYDIYPRKRDRATALQKWITKKLDSKADMIIADVANRIKNDPQWAKDGGKYIPHPSRYLHRELWNDEVESKTKRTDELGQIPEDRRW